MNGSSLAACVIYLHRNVLKKRKSPYKEKSLINRTILNDQNQYHTCEKNHRTPTELPSNWAQSSRTFQVFRGFQWSYLPYMLCATNMFNAEENHLSLLKNDKLIASIFINAPICRWFHDISALKAFEQLTSIHITYYLPKLNKQSPLKSYL